MRLPFIKSISTGSLLCFVMLSSSLWADYDERNLDYIIDRLLDAAGGRLGFNELKSIRVKGSISFENGSICTFTALKKQPDYYRITFDYRTHRIIEGYDGNRAWWVVEMPGKSESGLMEGQKAANFIREAPILNPLFNPDRSGFEITLEEPGKDANEEVYNIRVKYPDGWQTIYKIDKTSFREKRILNLDADGTVIDMIVPLKFEFVDGILFIFESNRIKDGVILNTLSIESTELNLGIIDSTFDMPTVDSAPANP